VFLFAYDKHRTRSFAYNLLSGARFQNAIHAFHSVRRHNDKVNVPRFGGINDFARWFADLDNRFRFRVSANLSPAKID
jgi:hypothetical protein